jgi:hypothetical protein
MEWQLLWQRMKSKHHSQQTFFSRDKGAALKLNIGNLYQFLFKNMLKAAHNQTICLLPIQADLS